ncbi:DUF1617 family protein [Weissella koreensis]|uniref:DUF1617 family protein n=1 Tax=Weissella koreensis TaxID=165096 RepID=UPI000CF322CE|nr:DUF1617 family protein [Weissella koreensis]AVH74707.1 hypothetical protein C4597_01150 [Weissella koreensis]QGN19930.1 DUF1617 family protein [Weissella koreensis]
MTQTLTFKNIEVAPVANFLNKLNLKNKASRGRTKLIKLLATKNVEYNDDRKEVSDPYFKDGELLKDADGNIDKENEAKARKVLEEIEQETAIIDFTEYSDKLKALYEAIINYPNEFSDSDAIIYDLLMDQFELVFEDNEKKEEK